MAQPAETGFLLSNGTQIIHGNGSIIRRAYPPETNLPGILEIFSLGHDKDATCPSFCGANGLFQFDTTCRMPRHVHMSPLGDGPELGYVVEKIIVLNGVAIAELEGEIYVVPPKTAVLIGRGVPHTWVAAPPGLDLHALGVADESVISDGQFLAVFEYEKATTFYPTNQTHVLKEEKEYVRCDDLHSIRIKEMDEEYLKQNAYFVWGKSFRKLNPH
ncbi:hypothetical protein BDV96DRAFT_683382 [Lophiotrema nucula]|uniref:RmlC-like cupin domain-containing protein n=1 Tax=Lophiotrema nucula TaxID=690887 RepID=A0A6A5ZRV6_9PLEO|nr:hypothetical protein BDV96DRAFT_683382 [Lophiotrema nucula]